MAVTKTITQTSSSITLTLSGFGTISATRTFKWYKGTSATISSMTLCATTTAGGEVSTVSYPYSQNMTTGGPYYVYCTMETSASTSTWAYGPYAVYPECDTYTLKSCSIRPSGASVGIYGLTSRPYARTFNATCGSYTKTGETIPANRTYASAYMSGSFTEGTSYSYSFSVVTPDNKAIIIGSDTATCAYDDTLVVTVGSQTETSFTVSCNVATSSARNLKLYVNNTLQETHSNITTGSDSFTVTGCNPATTYTIKVEVLYGSTVLNTYNGSASTTTPAMTLTLPSKNEYSLTARVNGLTANVGYTRQIKYYYKKAVDANYTQFTTVTVPQAATSASDVTIDVLASNETYVIKAELYVNNGSTAANSKTATDTTSDTQASIRSTNPTSNSLDVEVYNLLVATYDRILKWYFKRHVDNSYTLYDTTDELKAGTNLGGRKKIVVQGLPSSTSHDFKVEIIKGNVVLKTVTLSNVSTAADNTDVPHPTITNIIETTGSNEVQVYWGCGDHKSGYTYQIQYSTDESSYTDIGNSTTVVPETYSTITLPALNTTYYIRIHCYNTDDNTVYRNSSVEQAFIFGTFAWTTAKVQGNAFAVSATEFLTLCNLIIQKYDNSPEDFPDAGTIIDGLRTKLSEVSANAWIYGKASSVANYARAALDAMDATGVPDAPATFKKCEASFFNGLATAVNSI